MALDPTIRLPSCSLWYARAMLSVLLLSMACPCSMVHDATFDFKRFSRIRFNCLVSMLREHQEHCTITGKVPQWPSSQQEFWNGWMYEAKRYKIRWWKGSARAGSQSNEEWSMPRLSTLDVQIPARTKLEYILSLWRLQAW